MTGTAVRTGAAEGSGMRQVRVFLFLFWLCETVSGQIQYSIPEEIQRGSIVGNIWKDLGLDLRHVTNRNLRVVSAAENPYFTINAASGDLLVSDRIDREEMCGEATSCSIRFDTIADNPMNVFHVEVLIQDTNDNPPSFIKHSIDLDILESSLPGARLAVGNARDPDIGSNALQGYKLSSNQHFSIEETRSRDGLTFVELVLEKGLDREKQSQHSLILTAYDGGDPIRSSTVDININVLDANDNFPVFSQEVYRASISEGAANNSVVLQVKATDEDDGSNSKITYSFTSISDSALNTFSLDGDTGEVKIKGLLDFEKANSYKMVVNAKDGGGHVAQTVLLIDVFDVNDNAPEITFASVTSPVPEDSAPGTVVALINIRDRDSGENGEVECHIDERMPFKLIPSSGNIYKLVSSNVLDREKAPEYNVTVTATDKGTPPFATRRTVRLQLSDTNDNSPAFDQSSYQIFVPENNPSGASVYRVQASDLDLDENAHITYSILNNNSDNIPLSSFISINSQTGVIYAQCAFDYEQLREFQFQVKAQDAGSPPLSSNVTVRVFILDQNDNPPEILYPVPSSDDSVFFELVPPSSDSGYQVAKVVAVDADSGHNSWLSYHLLQAPEFSLFKIGLHTGEIRTSRTFMRKEPHKQNLVILVKDNGQPPLSATATLRVVFTEDLQEAIPELRNHYGDADDESNLKVYLVAALILISFLFIVTLMLAVIIRCRRPKGPMVCNSLVPALYPDIDPRLSTNYQNGTLPLPFSYEVGVALDSKQNEFTFLRSSQNMSTDILFSPNDSGIGNESVEGSIGNERSQEVSSDSVPLRFSTVFH
ncbi:protocadherin gamma-B5-like [Pleurodeles waltl]|uniref:protocadherin gamma-B5-like n=1 Tax=Pleurodeles waltl TaxID=8319 RepID=UPI00370994A2